MAGPVVIEAKDVTKRFVIRKDKSLKERVVNFVRSQRHREDFWALNGISADIEAGTSVGLIGANGSGKSTLLKVLGGIIEPTTGSIRRRGRLAALLELGAGFHGDLTGRENVYLNAAILGLSKAQVDKHLDDIVAFSGIEPFIDTQVKFYSSGMYVRLAFAVAVHVDPDVLLVDEVLAVGDEPFQRKCMDRIRSFQKEGRTILLVSHALEQVVEVCDRALVLENGRLIFDGEPRRATRILRDGFEEVRRQDIEQTRRAAADNDEPEVPAAEVTRVELLDGSGRRVEELTPGAPHTVRVHIRPTGRLTDWMVGIGVDDLGGRVLWGTNTRLLGHPMPATDRPVSVDFDLTGLYIGPGQYQLHGALATWLGPEIHRLPQAASFHVDTDDSTVGVLGISAKVHDPVPL